MKAKRKPTKRAALLSTTAAPPAAPITPAPSNPSPLADKGGLFADHVTEKELAEARGLSLRTLARERTEKRGPPYCKVGKKFYYSVAGWRKFLASREQESGLTEEGRPRR